LFQATNEFSANNLIGRGGIGSVYKARIQDGTEVAVKVFNLQYKEAFKSFDIECDMMKRIRHRNLIKIISSCSNDDFKALPLLKEDQSLTQTQTLATIGYMAP
ncbi:hypothetical protein CISIN_1g0383931mg, partial [Citrus sinensis]